MPRPALLASLAAIACVAACTQTPQAAAEPQQAGDPPAERTAPVRPPMRTGGFSASEIKGEEIEAARDLAVAAVYEQFPTRALVEEVTAETQVVAGLNYRFHIQMSGDPGPAYDAVVYRDLQKNMKVTSVKKAE